MSFKDQSFESRFTRMGDEAEGVFEEVIGKGFVRYGLNRPPINMASLPPMVRYTPDYLCHNSLVEVQGVGRDRTVKLKVDKYTALLQWSAVMPTQLFIWDNVDKTYCSIPIEDFPIGVAQLDRFPEGKPYFAVDVEDIPAAWTGVNDAF